MVHLCGAQIESKQRERERAERLEPSTRDGRSSAASGQKLTAAVLSGLSSRSLDTDVRAPGMSTLTTNYTDSV